MKKAVAFFSETLMASAAWTIAPPLVDNYTTHLLSSSSSCVRTGRRALQDHGCCVKYPG